MKWADGTVCPAVLQVDNAAGAWFTDSADPMFQLYLYPLSRQGNVALNLMGVPEGPYDVYVYAHGRTDAENAAVTISSGGITLGPKRTSADPGWNTTNWQNGVQFVLFTNVPVASLQPLVVTSQPDASDLAVINGLQLLQVEPPPCMPHAATATAMVAYGFLVNIDVKDGGCGYTEAPKVLIRSGGGSGAEATAIIKDGVVTGFQIVANGRGYTNAPTVLVASPPHAPWLGIGVSKVRVTQHVVLGHKYVLESSADLVTWNQVGPVFTAEDEVVTQEFDVSETGRYFSIREVP